MSSINVKDGGFTTELFSSKVNVNLDKQGCYTDIVNRKYEGEIKNQGDTVTFYTIGSLTANDYDPATPTIAYANPNGDKLQLKVDQIKVIPFTIDKIRELQSNLDLVNQYAMRTAVAGGQVKDTFIHGLAVAGATSKLHNSAAIQITKDNVWAEICEMGAILTRKNAITTAGVDYAGKRPALVITPEFEGILQQSANFFANGFGEAVLKTGQIGRIGKFEVYVNTNVEAGAEQTIVALTSDAITYAEQLTETETLKDKDQLGVFVRNTLVYGGLVANPDAIVTSKVKYTA